MKRQRLIFLLVLLAFGSNFAAAKGNPAAGRNKAQVCAACHGKDGNGTSPMFPRLAGQYPEYLVHTLQAYKNGDRSNAIMAPQAKNLSDQDIADLASYYASLNGLKVLER